jgi:ELWxxDGT repeat protein
LVTSVSIICCSDGSTQPEKESDRETGTLSLKADWPIVHALTSNSQLNAVLDCDAMNVDNISAHVFSDTGELLRKGGPWNCAAGSGTISKVPVGDNRLVRLYAFDPDGTEIYRGEVPDVSVQSQQTVQVDVLMDSVFSRDLSLVRDVYPGTGSSFPHRLAEFQGQLHFVALDPNFGFELFNTDSAQVLRDIYPNGVLDRTGVMAPTDFVELNGKLYFFANDGNRYLLWRTGGTAASTEPVASSADYFNPTELTALQDKLFFTADSVDAGRELWVFEESATQIKLFHDIRQGQAGSNPQELTVVGDDLFFVANNGSSGYEIWRTNAQEEQCSRETDIYYEEGSSAPRHLTNVNGTLFFRATDGTQNAPLQLYGNEVGMIVKEGDTYSVYIVADINDTSKFSGSSRARNLTWVHDNTVAFSAYAPDTGQELYLYDWQNDKTPRLYDLNPSEASSFPGNFVYLNGSLFFTAYNSQDIEHVWAYPLDGSRPAQCLTSHMQHPAPRNLTVVNQTIYFTASHDTLGRGLWATDGTRTGRVVGADGGDSPLSPANLFAASSNDRLYYTAFDTDYGEELFQLVDQ